MLICCSMCLRAGKHPVVAADGRGGGGVARGTSALEKNQRRAGGWVEKVPGRFGGAAPASDGVENCAERKRQGGDMFWWLVVVLVVLVVVVLVVGCTC